MKKLAFVAVAAFVAVSALAQNEQIHVFRNDQNFNSFKGADVQSITYQGTDEGYRTMNIAEADGTTSITMNNVDSVVLRSTGLPEIHVNLTDEPEWTELQGSKSDEHPALLRMDGNGMFEDLPEQEVTFRGRGNSTWNMKKKPYRFKLGSKTALCGLPKAKSFALIANYIDCSLMRNTIALWIANYLEMPFANHCVPVKVYFNGLYKGQYMLTEKIGIGGGSVDIEETEGMLFELDSNYDEDFKFYFNLDGTNKLPVMVKDPDIAELVAEGDLTGVTADEYFNIWKNDFSEMATAIMNTPADGSLKEYIDIESVVNFFIVNTVANNHEMQHPKSFYIHKAKLDGVYSFGPVWDFDWAFTFNGKEGAPYNSYMVASNGDRGGYTFISAIFRNQEVLDLFAKKWNDFVTNGYPQLKAYMEEYALLIEPTAKENGLLWPADYSTSWRLSESSFEFRQNFETLKTWLDNRIDFCSDDDKFGVCP